jgi:glycosyltransferase involved in cell wall biosynthesis
LAYVKKFNRIDSKNNILTVIGTPGLLPPRFRTGGFAFLDCIIKMFYVLANKFDAIQVESGHRPSAFLPCLTAKLFKNSVLIDECWEWLGKGGYAEIRKGVLGKFVSLYDSILEFKLKIIFDWIIVVSTALKKRFRNPKNVDVLYGGAENKNFRAYSIEEARVYLEQPANWKIIGMSNLTCQDHENNKIFLKAIKTLCNDMPDCYLMATGTDSDYIQELEIEYQLRGKIIFPGYVEFKTYNMYMSACNIYVLPFADTNINRGRWPNKIGDYLCLKRPIISNPTGDIEKIFQSYHVGALCQQTEESFYLTLKHFFEDNKTIRYRKSDAEYLVDHVLSFEKRIERMLGIFSNALKEKSI